MRGRTWLVAVVASTAIASGAGPLKQVGYFKASNPGAGDHFGCGGTLTGHTGNAAAISSDGNIIAIGAPHESSSAKGINGNQNDNSLYSSGAVYVFTRKGATWAQEAYIKPSNPGEGNNFGAFVALSRDGTTLAVSAHWEPSGATGINGNQSDDSIPQAGAVYVFTRRGRMWSQQAYIKASNTGNRGVGDELGDGDQFGYSLALSADGNTLAAGAISEDSGGNGINNLASQADDSKISTGAAYVFTRTGETWTQQAYVKPSNPDAGDLFGYSIGLSASGNTLAVGSYDEDGSAREINGTEDNMRTGSGAIYVFDRTAGTWSQSAYLKASNAEAGDSLGYSLAISEDGNTIAAGAADEDCMSPGINPSGCDNDRTSDQSNGAAYIFVRHGHAWAQQAFIKSSHPGKEDWFGVRIAISGDGNTVAVGAQNEDGGVRGINGNQADDSAGEAGAVYLFSRTGTAWTQVAYVKGSNTKAADEFGSSIALGRDGRTMLVGARGEDSAARGVNGNQNDTSAAASGAAYLFRR